MLVKCLYCDAPNDGQSTGAYCESCGKKLPTSAMLRTKRSLDGTAPEIPGERTPLPRKSRLVSEALFAAAIVHLFAGGLFLVVGPMLYPKVPDGFAPHVLSWAVLPTLAIGLLGVFARLAPMPAVIVTMALALLWVAATFIIHTPLALGWLLVDATLLGMLAWAMWRGMVPEKRAGG